MDCSNIEMETDTSKKKKRILYVNDFRSCTTKVVEKAASKLHKTPSKHFGNEISRGRQDKETIAVFDSNNGVTEVKITKGDKLKEDTDFEDGQKSAYTPSEESDDEKCQRETKANSNIKKVQKQKIIEDEKKKYKGLDNSNIEELVKMKDKVVCSSGSPIIPNNTDIKNTRNTSIPRNLKYSKDDIDDKEYKDKRYITEYKSESHDVKQDCTTNSKEPEMFSKDVYRQNYKSSIITQNGNIDIQQTGNRKNVENRNTETLNSSQDTTTQNKSYMNNEDQFIPKSGDCDTRKDCSTQTDFVYRSTHDQYSLLCEKCGHVNNIEEVLLNLINSIQPKCDHKCAGLRESNLTEINQNPSSNEFKTERIPSGLNTPETITITSEIKSPDYRSNHQSKLSKSDLHQHYTKNSVTGHQFQHRDNLTRQAREQQSFDDTYTELNNCESLDHSIEPSAYKTRRDGKFKNKFPLNHEPYASNKSEREISDTRTQHCAMDQTNKDNTEEFHPNENATDQLNQALGEFNEKCMSFETSKKKVESLKSFEVSELSENTALDHRTPINNAGLDTNDESTDSNNVTMLFSFSIEFSEPNDSNEPSSPSSNKDKLESTSQDEHTKKDISNKKSYKSRTEVVNKLPDFAAENFLEVFDVTSDGNCMFSAVVDQLWITGNFTLTSELLRKKAVEFLRRNPSYKDGTHLQSFLTEESWDEYLRRMERIGEWGDQMMLQGIAEVTFSRIIVVNCDLIKTELTPWHTTYNLEELEVLILGHIGEYHYVSLRPSNWQELWPIKAKIRLLRERTIKDSNSSCSDKGMKLSGNDITDGDEDEEARLLEEDLSHITTRNRALIERSKALSDLYKFEDDWNNIFDNDNFIDPVSSLPIGHLTFYLRELVQIEDIHFKFYNVHNPSEKFVYGSVGEHLVLHLHGHWQHIIIYPEILYFRPDIADIVYVIEGAWTSHTLLIDMTSCKPGFLRLQVLDQKSFENSIELEDKLFLQELPMKVYTELDYHTKPVLKQGIQCTLWPQALTSEFWTRTRPSGWPTSEILDDLSKRPCHIRKFSHPLSEHPDIEWQFIFPYVEIHLIKCVLDIHMLHVLRFFKLLIDNQTSSSPKRLRTNHIKTIMLLSCEIVPIKVWSTNMGGAILFLISTLMKYLRERKIPHYIMNSVNLLESYTDQEMESLLIDLEHIRLFPIMSANVFAETNHLENLWIVKPIMNDMHRFLIDRNYKTSLEETFCPTLMKLARMSIMNGVHSYSKSLELLIRLFDKVRDMEEENRKDTPQTIESFVEGFVYSIDDPVNRYFFTHFLDIHLRIHVLDRISTSEGVRKVGEIVEKESCGRFNNFPIPDGCLVHDVKYLYHLAEYLFLINELDSAAHFLRCGIAMAKEVIQTETICVPETAEDDVKQQIADKNTRTIQNLNYILYDFYERLKECYKTSNQSILFQEFIHDYEQLVIIFNKPCLYGTLARSWRELGNDEKAEYFYEQVDKCRENNKH